MSFGVKWNNITQIYTNCHIILQYGIKNFLYYRLGNCDNFTFGFNIQMWDWIINYFIRNHEIILYSSNNSKPNNDKLNVYKFKCKYLQKAKNEIKLFVISCNF